MNFDKVSMKKAPCKRHKIQYFMPVSPWIADKIKNNQTIDEKALRRINVHSEGKTFEYIVDCEFFESFLSKNHSKNDEFFDRDKENKTLNDRLVIQELISQMQWVCLKCFTESIATIDVQ